MPPKSKPFPHQVKGILKMEEHDGNLLQADEMGLGKTIMILGLLHRNPQYLPCVVVCPAAVKYNWEAEALMHFGLRASVCEGEEAPVPGQYDHLSDVIVINYDILVPKESKKKAPKNRRKKRSWADFLAKLNPNMLVMDECQSVSDPSSKRTKACKRIAKIAGRCIPMSGTPILNRPKELFSILNMLWPSEFPSFSQYAHRYCGAKLTQWGWDYSGSSNLDELNQRLNKLGMLRRKKENELKMPNRNQRVTQVQLSDRQQYSLASTDFESWVQKHRGKNPEKIGHAMKMAKVGYLVRLAAELKLKAAARIINKWLEENPGKKCLVFAIQIEVVKYFQEHLNTKTLVINGGVTGRRRQTVVTQFQTDEQYRACICNMKSAGLGINLTRAVKSFVIELWWNPATIEQALDRNYRIGQSEDVDVEFILADKTIEQKVFQTISKRQSITSKVIDGVKDDGTEQRNVYAELIDEMIKI